MSVLIKGGTIVTAEHTYRGDVLCVDGKIAAIGDNLEQPSGVEIVDAFGDQEWEVLGECSGFPDQEVEFVDYFGDITVEIVDAFGDQTICITNADELDYELREKLGLND